MGRKCLTLVVGAVGVTGALLGCGGGTTGETAQPVRHGIEGQLAAEAQALQVGTLAGRMVVALSDASGDVASSDITDASGAFELPLPDDVRSAIVCVLNDTDGDDIYETVDCVVGYDDTGEEGDDGDGHAEWLWSVPPADAAPFRASEHYSGVYFNIGAVALDDDWNDTDLASGPAAEFDSDGDGIGDLADADADDDGTGDDAEEDYLTGLDDELPWLFDDDWDNDDIANVLDDDDDGDGLWDDEDLNDYGIELPDYLDEDNDGEADWSDSDWSADDEYGSGWDDGSWDDSDWEWYEGDNGGNGDNGDEGDGWEDLSVGTGRNAA